MNRQEALDKAYLGIMDQGRCSIKKSTGFCAYRGTGKAKCAIGWLIDDKTAKSIFQE